MQFKLPNAIVDTYGDALRAHDWASPFNLSQNCPGRGFEPWDVILQVRPGVVAAKGLGTMMRLRRAADAIAPPVPQSDEETARILALRNPAVEQDDTKGPNDDGA